MDRKQSQGKRAEKPEQGTPAREGFGDDMGTRVGRPDPAGAGALDDRSMARLSENADDRGLEGAILAGSENPEGSAGQRGTEGGARTSTRADGSDMDDASRANRGETLDHTQRAESGMGGEANQGVHGAQIERGTDEQGPAPDRPGSEPLRGRQREHDPSYGGKGGAPRTSSDQREGGVDYYGDEGTGKKR